MKKIVINVCYGGFGLSAEAEAEYKKRKDITDPDWYWWDIDRDDPILIEMVERGQKVSGTFADLKVVEIPDDVKWHIEEYDGMEHVAEDHRTWS
jgi:hypothetical protein